MTLSEAAVADHPDRGAWLRLLQEAVSVRAAAELLGLPSPSVHGMIAGGQRAAVRLWALWLLPASAIHR